MSTQRESLTLNEVKAITAAARNSPLQNMRHAAALEALCQKLEAYFAARRAPHFSPKVGDVPTPPDAPQNQATVARPEGAGDDDN